MKKRKPLAGRSGGSANQPSRDRRDSQAAANTPLAFPLRVNAQGQLELVRHAQGAVGLDPSRGIFIIVHPPLKLVPGSPFGISIEHDDSLAVENDRLTSSPSTNNVRDGSSSLDITLARLQATKQSRSEKDVADGYAGLDSAGLILLSEIPPGAVPGAHATTHQDGGTDEVAVETAAAGAIPKADSRAHLDPSWYSFGSGSGEVCEGNDARLSDSRAPSGTAGGDLTGTYPNPTIGVGKVTLAQQANMATASVVYRKTAGSGAPEVQTLATLKTDLGLTGTNSGDQTITLTGNVTGSGTGSFATTIAASAVTLAMQANMATASLVYRKTAGSGAPEVNTLATLKTDLGLTGTNSGDQTITLTGDVTGSGTGSFAATIAAAAVTLAKMANMATASLFYRKTAGSGAPEVNTLATLKTDLGLTGTNSGDQTVTLTGDVTGSGTGSFAATIANSAVTLAKQADMATASVVYRKTAGTGAPEVQTLATLKNDLGLSGSNNGDQVEADSYSSFQKIGTSSIEVWYWAGTLTGVATTTLAVSANKAYAIPFVAAKRTGGTMDRVAINATIGAGNVRLALYDEVGGVPTNLKTDYGVVAASGVSSITISQALSAGKRYFLCAVFDNTPTIRAISQNAAFAMGTDNTLGGNANTHITATMTYGAWAGTFPTTGMAAATAQVPGIAVRFSA